MTIVHFLPKDEDFNKRIQFEAWTPGLPREAGYESSPTVATNPDSLVVPDEAVYLNRTVSIVIEKPTGGHTFKRFEFESERATRRELYEKIVMAIKAEYGLSVDKAFCIAGGRVATTHPSGNGFDIHCLYIEEALISEEGGWCKPLLSYK